jgi:hypothetical protein
MAFDNILGAGKTALCQHGGQQAVHTGFARMEGLGHGSVYVKLP